jgi:hypothetical protein
MMEHPTSKDRMKSELARLRQVIETQSAMTRYAARMGLLWERRWIKLKAQLEEWLAQAITPPFASDEQEDAYEDEPDSHDTIDNVLGLMRVIADRLPADAPPPVACDVSQAELGEEGAHHCRTHRVWYSTPTGESRTPCPVGRVETELAKLRGVSEHEH